MPGLRIPSRPPQLDADISRAGHADAAQMMSVKHFNFIRAFAKKHAALALADHKHNMVHRRVSKRLHALGIASFESYCALLAGPDGAQELQPLINALTTNKTEFFREIYHFRHLATTAIPALIAAKAADHSRRLRIWSAGCSSGQEPYSIAITLRECLADLPQIDAKILATDIDTDILEQARQGIYKADDISSIPSNLRGQYLEPLAGTPKQYQINAALRAQVLFKQLNLDDQWPLKGPFDVIFCRNVVIYFDKPTQCRLFDKFANLLHDDGFLYIGHSESLYRVSERFQPIGQCIYQKIV